MSQSIKFYKGSTSSFTSYVAGGVYFCKDTGLIKVGNTTGDPDVFGGDVKDATFTNNKLTISFNSGKSNVVLDFSDVASASTTESVCAGIVARVKALEDAAGDKTGENNGVSVEVKTSAGAVSEVIVSAPDFDSLYDAKNAASTAEKNAKDYADGLAKNYATADQGAKADSALQGVQVNGADLTKDSDNKVNVTVAEGATTGTISVNGSDVAVHGLGTAAASNVATVAIGSKDEASDALPTVAQVEAYTAGLVGAMHFRGTVTGDDAATALATITDPASGDVALYGTQEYVYNGTKWELFGDEGAYEVKGTAKDLIDKLAGGDNDTDDGIKVTVTSAKGEVTDVDVDASGLNYIKSASVSGNTLTLTPKTGDAVTFTQSDDQNATEVALTSDYEAASEYAAPAANDTVQVAIGKLAKGVADAAAGGVQSVSTSGSYLVEQTGSTGTVTITSDDDAIEDKISTEVETAKTAILGEKDYTQTVKSAYDLADSKIASVSGETAVSNSSYVNVAVSASTDGNKAVTLSSTANVTTKAVKDATSTDNGLATAYDVQQYIATSAVTSVVGVDAIKPETASTGAVSVSISLDNSGNVEFSQSSTGLKGDIIWSDFA